MDFRIVVGLWIQHIGEGASIMASTGDQLSLWTRELVVASRDDWPQERGQLDVSFLHRGFCIMGMPLRQPKDSLRPFSRHDGRFALTIEPASVTSPGMGDLLI